MGLEDWNWRLPTDLQDVSWDCAATSLAWCLRSIGRSETEADVVAGLGPARISPAYGLLDASGAGIVSYLSELGIGADNDPDSSWQENQDAGGFQPLLIGGRAWCHWVAVRLSSQTVGRPDLQTLWLMNPAPGWMGVSQTMTPDDYQRLGSFSSVWFSSW